MCASTISLAMSLYIPTPNLPEPCVTSEVESRFQLVHRTVVKVNHLILVLFVLTVLEYSNINSSLLNFVEIRILSPFLFDLNS